MTWPVLPGREKALGPCEDSGGQGMLRKILGLGMPRLTSAEGGFVLGVFDDGFDDLEGGPRLVARDDVVLCGGVGGVRYGPRPRLPSGARSRDA